MKCKSKVESEDKSDQLFKSVRSVYIALAAYVNKVGQEIGIEKAMELLSNSFAEVGTYQGKKLKKLADKEKLNADEAYELMKVVPKSMGINFMIPQKDSNNVITRLDKCPVYECAKVVGLDIGTFCNNSAIPYFNAIAKQLNIDLEFNRNKVKTSESDFCEEQLTLKK